jgi:hypothetical protein
LGCEVLDLLFKGIETSYHGCHGCRRWRAVVGSQRLLWLPGEIVEQGIADDRREGFARAPLRFELGIDRWRKSDRHAVDVSHGGP